MAFVLNYPAHVYEAKISELEGYRTVLNGHLDVLRGYRDQVRHVWPDAHGQHYYELLSDQIEEVQKANNRIENLKLIYEEAVGEFTIIERAFDDVLNDAKSIIAGLG